MSRFKTGDRVVLKENYGVLPKGAAGVFVNYDLPGFMSDLCTVRFKGDTEETLLYAKHLNKVTKEKEHMNKFKVGDKVRLVCNNACSDHKVGDVGYVVAVGTGTYGNLLVEVNGYSNRGSTWSYPSDLRLVTEVERPTTLKQSWVESLTKAQKRNLLRMVEDSLATEEITLYSVAGRKWGKKRVPETKLKMTYKMVNGKIQGQPKVENV